jgi:K+-transporting ATPase ATPase C chain
VRELIQQNTDPADLGILGDPGVNVLRLNLALDAIVSGEPRTAMAGLR